MLALLALRGGEGDSPKLQRFLILLDKFNSVGAETFHRADLRYHARSSPVNPTDACNAIRVLRRFPRLLRTRWELWAADRAWCLCIGVT